jgi:hypothetical protein
MSFGNHTQSLLKQICGPHSQRFWFSGGLRICISHSFLGDVMPLSRDPTLRTTNQIHFTNKEAKPHRVEAISPGQKREHRAWKMYLDSTETRLVSVFVGGACLTSCVWLGHGIDSAQQSWQQTRCEGLATSDILKVYLTMSDTEQHSKGIRNLKFRYCSKLQESRWWPTGLLVTSIAQLFKSTERECKSCPSSFLKITPIQLGVQDLGIVVFPLPSRPTSNLSPYEKYPNPSISLSSQIPPLKLP